MAKSLPKRMKVRVKIHIMLLDSPTFTFFSKSLTLRNFWDGNSKKHHVVEKSNIHQQKGKLKSLQCKSMFTDISTLGFLKYWIKPDVCFKSIFTKSYQCLETSVLFNKHAFYYLKIPPALDQIQTCS